MRTKFLKVFFIVTLLLLNLQLLSKGVMSAAPTYICLKGRLFDGVANVFIYKGYVFAVSTDTDEILGYSITGPAEGPNSGSWEITGLPASGEVLLVGFYPTFKFNIAMKKVELKSMYQDIGLLTTAMASRQMAPGGATGTAWDVLSLAGWIVGEVNSKNANEQATKLAQDLLNRIEDKTAYKKATNEFMLNYKFPEDFKDSYFDYDCSFNWVLDLEHLKIIKVDLDQDGVTEYFCNTHGMINAHRMNNQVFCFIIWEEGNLQEPEWFKVVCTKEEDYYYDGEIGNLGKKPIIVIRNTYYSFKMGKTIYDKSCLIYYANGEYKFVVKE